MSLVITAKPQWIAKMYVAKVGRDHLGLGSVSSDQILPSLSPSINVLDFHPRYHSYYAFLLDEFWRRDLPRSRRAWIDFYRPREFIFSVGAYMCDQPEHGQLAHIVGGRKAGPLAAQNLPTYLSNTDYIDSELGGYGLYYRTVMAELGIIYPGGKGLPYPVDVPSEYGKEVAETFRLSVKDTQYFKRYFDSDEIEVPRDVVQEFGRKACLCQLKTPDAPDRPYLLDTFLHKGNPSAAASRRETFLLFLDIADQTKDHGLSEESFRQLIYFGKTSSGVSYQPNEWVIDVYKRWRLYQAREYYAFALNALWYFLCDWGVHQGGVIDPIPLAQFWEYLDQSVDFNQFASTLGIPQPNITLNSGFRDLTNWLLKIADASVHTFDSAWGINRPVQEYHLYQLASDQVANPAVGPMVTGMIIMLALIQLRFGDPDLWGKPEWEISKMGSDGRLSLDGFVRQMQRRLKSGPVTIREILIWLYEDYVILQHQIVATRKLPDNTFRFQREGSRLKFNNLENPLAFMSSRFEAISTTIYDLGLCGDFAQPGHDLTEDGGRLLNEGDLV